jgi:diguanylate cyclase (GGDEF)-like protein
VPIDQLALLFLVIIAANLVVLVALAFAWRGRRAGSDHDRPLQHTMSEGTAGASPRLRTSVSTVPPAVYQRVVRVASLVFIVAAMVVVQLTGSAFVTPVVLFLALGAVAIILSQEILPTRNLGNWRLPVEAGAAIAFLTVLLVLTGGHASPFFFGYILLLGAASLWASGFGSAILALATSAAYLIGVLLPFNSVPGSLADVGRIAFNLIALVLVAYVSAIVGREQRRAREEALRLSRFDSLTGLHSRDFFLAEMEQEILRAARSGRPFALLMLDLDGLKAANDRFGHASGDTLLRAVADTLRGDVRITDVAARWGGDEFVLLLPETDLTGAMLVADKVRIDIGRLALPNDGLVVRTSASVGLVTYPDDGKSSTELMRRADLAMYEAKRRGRDQVVRFAREAKADAAPIATKPIGVVEASLATSNGSAGPLSGLPAPAVVVNAEGGSMPVQVANSPYVFPTDPALTDPVLAAPVPAAPVPPEGPAVPSPWIGRAPWESTGN